ncbi:glycosyltransferase [Pseudarthrobacter oxydans]|uniref:glycosyltransferase n=1 Tax=Pseudarthrobacter oxydans TaxID=1671 RepID=UPI003D2E7268
MPGAGAQNHGSSLARRRLEELQYAEQTLESRQHYYTSSHYLTSVLSGEPELPSRNPQEYLTRRNASPMRDYVDYLRPMLENLPQTLGSRALRPHPAKVGMIADEFLYKSMDSTAALTYVTPDNYVDTAESVEVLVVASTWRGLDNEWSGLATPESKKRRFLLEQVLPHFRAINVPIVFYSKEDPPNYQEFLAIAQAADFIFTSAAEVVDDYRRDCAQAISVGVLSFGVNPLHHSPVYSRRHRLPDVLFAGSWHAHKYSERRSGARKIFEGVVASSRNLIIFDRNWDLEASRYFFPDEYTGHMAPAVEHDILLKLQRIADFNINLNSVISSPSMYANRVVELQAMGSMVISNYNAGINNRFPAVLTAETSADVCATLDRMSGVELYEVQMEGLRRAYSDHLAHDRMAEILRAVGVAATSGPPRVCAVSDAAAHGAAPVAATQTLEGVTVVTPAELQRRRGEFDIAVPLSDRYSYAATHIEDLVNGFKYADVDFVMKAFPAGAGTSDVPEHEASASMPEPAVGAVWVASEAGDKYLRDQRVEGSGYAMDRLGVHTRQETIGVRGMGKKMGQEFLLSVIIPVYNNGPHLLNKCMRSLSRSSIFDRMQILLVDDGSSDLRTRQILEELALRHHQVRLYRFEVGGSGSASRARNKGLELATAPWITYLDPDNEAVEDGYAKLVELCTRNSLDFALGDMLMYAETVKHLENARILARHLQDHEGRKVVPYPDILQRLAFYPMSIQAMVINAEWLKSLGLEQPVGALGQDSFFFQQLVHEARRIDVLHQPIHIYYGSVEGSVVNTVGPEFFRKYIPLEAARAGWLRGIGQIEEYKRTRAQSFMKYWYLPKLKLVEAQDYPEAVSILHQLAAFYEPITWEDAEVAAVLKVH